MHVPHSLHAHMDCLCRGCRCEVDERPSVKEAAFPTLTLRSPLVEMNFQWTCGYVFASSLPVFKLPRLLKVGQRDHFALCPQKRAGLLGTGTGGRGRKSEGSTADTAPKRPERPWTAARTMEVLRRCPCAIAVSTAVFGQRVTRTMSVALLLSNNSKRKKSNFRSPAPPPYS